MKRKVLKTDLIDTIHETDRRTKSWTDKEIDKVITNAFVELLTLDAPFSREVRVDLEEYRISGESKGVIHLDYSVVMIYDMFLLKELSDDSLYDRGEKRNSNSNVIWRNPQAKDQVFFNLKSSYIDDVYETLVVKYYYVPTDSNFQELLLNSDEYVALDTALEVAVLAKLKDYDGSEKVRRRLVLLGGNLTNIHPTDWPGPDRRIFGGYADV